MRRSRAGFFPIIESEIQAERVGKTSEHPVPVEHYEYACANPIRIEADGCVSAPDGPGLGLDLDWKQIERDASLVIDTETMS